MVLKLLFLKRTPKTANSFQQGSLGQHDTRRIRRRLQKGLQPDGSFFGIARRLLAEVLQRAQSLPGVEKIILTVGDHQAAAQRVYSSLGFSVFGHERAALKIGDVSVDEDYMVYEIPEASSIRE